MYQVVILECADVMNMYQVVMLECADVMNRCTRL